MGKLGFYFDMTACIGCRTCHIACKDRNDLDVGAIFRTVRNFETGTFPKPGSYNYSSSCNHCEEAKCMKNCPTGAMHKGDDGTVQHDPDLCIGCQYCIWNCPYGAPVYFEELGRVGKCDSCKTLREAGQNPACVDACPMRCLKFGDLDELTAQYGNDLVKELPILVSQQITKPSILIKPKSSALDGNFREKDV